MNFYGKYRTLIINNTRRFFILVIQYFGLNFIHHHQELYGIYTEILNHQNEKTSRDTLPYQVTRPKEHL